MTLAAILDIFTARNISAEIVGGEVHVDAHSAAGIVLVDAKHGAVDAGARYLGQIVGAALPMGSGRIASSRVYRFAA